MAINPELLQFLRELANNNEKTWFDAHKTEYKHLRQEFVDFLSGLAERIAFFDSSVQLRLGEPKLVKVFRINRDLRFTKDKRPYKTNMAGTIGFGDGEGRPGYYVNIEPDNNAVGGGIYMPSSPVLQSIRETVAEKHEELQKIVSSPEFVAAFPAGLTQHDALKTAPRGYNKDHPAIEFLRLKSFAALRNFSDEEVTQDSFVDETIDSFEALSKLNAFLGAALR
jgi:uncharacterized protein (TIGR02453 family)